MIAVILVDIVVTHVTLASTLGTYVCKSINMEQAVASMVTCASKLPFTHSDLHLMKMGISSAFP
jgi:hypothetical protein